MGILRRIKRLVVSPNPHDNTMDTMGTTDEIHNLSDADGSLESVFLEQQLNCHCGCFAPPGGRCSECGKISCVRCHRHCGGTDGQAPIGCGRPLCRAHCQYLALPDGQALPLCSRCYGRFVRGRRWKSAAMLLLSPFIEPEERT
jgi:hypothetical protein